MSSQVPSPRKSWCIPDRMGEGHLLVEAFRLSVSAEHLILPSTLYNVHIADEVYWVLHHSLLILSIHEPTVVIVNCVIPGCIDNTLCHHYINND